MERCTSLLHHYEQLAGYCYSGCHFYTTNHEEIGTITNSSRSPATSPNSTAAVTVWYEVRQCSLGIHFCLSLLLVAWMILKHTVCHNYIKRLSVCISLYLSCIKLNRIVKALHACHEGVNKTEQLLLLLNRSWKWHQLCCFATSSSL